jgi:maltose/maltodextrin transport system substrate-binding protein/arabinogalactan oligomer/maltooligosaccharide transport system substrate-binding protein
MNAVWGAWGDAMELISTQKMAPQEALDNAQKQIEAAIAGQ